MFCLLLLLLHWSSFLPVDSLGAVTFPASEHRLWCMKFGSYSPCVGSGVVICRARGSQASVVVTQGLSCSIACGIFWDQGWNSCLLHRQVNSCPLYHQGSLIDAYLIIAILLGLNIRPTYDLDLNVNLYSSKGFNVNADN